MIVRVLWFYWTVSIYWQLCVIHTARHLSSFQNGNVALGIKLETTAVQKVEDPLALMLPILKTEQEVRYMSVCPEFKEIQVCLMDYQSLFLHTKWLQFTSGKTVTKCQWSFVQWNPLIQHLIIQKSGQGKTVPTFTVKAYMGYRGIAPFIINLITRWRWVVNFVPWPTQSSPPPSKKPWHPLSVTQGGPQKKSAIPCWET
jgi:hypothetical protein